MVADRRAAGEAAVALVSPAREAERLAHDAGARLVRAPVGREAVVDDAVGDAEWLWLLDPHVAPRAGALERLLHAALSHDALPTPALVASKVVSPDGQADAWSLPWPRFTDKALTVAAAERRLVAIRAARRGSLLVRRDVALASPLPSVVGWAGGGDLVWTAAILRDAPGLLAPESVALREATTLPLSRDDVRARARLLCGDALRLDERLWSTAGLVEDVARSRDPRAVVALARGLAGR